MSKLVSKFQVFDLFGTTFNFTTYKNKKFHTPLGLVLSFVVYVLISSFIGVFGVDLFNRTNPKVIYQQVRPVEYPNLIPDLKNFTFAWTLEDDFGYWNMTNRLFSRIIYRKMKRDSTGTLQIISERYLEKTPCTTKNVEDPLFISGFNLHHWYCLNFKDQNVSIGGFWDSNFLDLLSVEIYFCPDNNSTHPNCTTIDKIKEYSLIQKLYFSAIYPQFYFDVTNLDNNLRYHYIIDYNIISMNIIRTDNLYLKTVEAQDDQNLIRTEFKEHKQMVFDKFVPMLAFKDTNDYENKNLGTDLYTYYIYYSKGKDLYVRTFMKLQDLAALVGGFMTIIMTIGKLICSHYNNYQRYIYLINELFVYEEMGNAFDIQFEENSNNNVAGEEVSKVQNNTKQTQINSSEANQFNTENLKAKIVVQKKYKDESNIQLFNSSKILINSNKSKFVPETKKVIEEKKRENESKPEIQDKVLRTALSDNKLIFIDIDQGTKKGYSSKRFEQISQKLVNNLQKETLSREDETQLEKRKTALYVLPKLKENLIRTKLNQNKKLAEKNKENKWFSLGFCLFMRRFILKSRLSEDQKKRIKTYDFAIEYIVDKLDIAHYINMFQTIDKIKLFSYNDSQVIGLNYSKRPNLNDMEELRLLDIKPEKYKQDDDANRKVPTEVLNLKEYEEEEQLQLIKYFLKKLKLKGFDEIDKKIFDTLETDLKNLILEEFKQIS